MGGGGGEGVQWKGNVLTRPDTNIIEVRGGGVEGRLRGKVFMVFESVGGCERM